MLQNFLNAWRVPDLRTKLLFTAAMLGVYRFGSYLPTPGVDSQRLSDLLSGQTGVIYNLLADRWQISTDMDVNYMLTAEKAA